MDTARLLDRFPRVSLVQGATPIQRLRRLEAALHPELGATRLFVKRDDLMALGGGGSKLRKLEFLLGEALVQGADTLIATGLRQSNSTRLAAAAAAHLGLRMDVGLRARSTMDSGEYAFGGNALLAELFGAAIHSLPHDADVKTFAAERAAALDGQGRTAYVIPAGASSPLGSLGYVAAALEIAQQEIALGIEFDRVIVANGSSGTHAGLIAGFALLGRRAPVHGFSVLHKAADAHAATLALARAALELLGRDDPIHATDVTVNDAFRGPGYGHATKEAVDAIRMLGAHEGLLLDPVYGGKAFAGLLHEARTGALKTSTNVLFLLAGGTPALDAYRDDLLPAQASGG
jgi:L-cysteate sulfo-lyase